MDLGCGFGWFCRWARENGAAQVLGLDVSENMLARAAAMTSDPAIAYVRADLEVLDLPEYGFDLAYSSLALHYIADIPALLAKLHRALAPGGMLVFSVEHPIFMAPSRPGWAVDAEGRKTWPLDDYAIEGERRTDWLAPRVLKYHRRLGSWMNALVGAGFAIAHVEEWAPTEAQVKARPDWAEELLRPMFLLVSAKKI